MIDLHGGTGELRAVIHIKRAATGETETYELIGHPDPDRLQELIEAERKKRAHAAGGAMAGQGSALVNDKE